MTYYLKRLYNIAAYFLSEKMQYGTGIWNNIAKKAPYSKCYRAFIKPFSDAGFYCLQQGQGPDKR